MDGEDKVTISRQRSVISRKLHILINAAYYLKHPKGGLQGTRSDCSLTAQRRQAKRLIVIILQFFQVIVFKGINIELYYHFLRACNTFSIIYIGVIGI